MTEEQKQQRRDNLARARERQREKMRLSKAAAEAAAAPEHAPAPSPPTDDPDLALTLGALDAAADPPGFDEAAARRLRLLGDLDADTAALFTDAELEAIEAEERDKARAEAKKLAIADVRAVARQRARIDNDLIPADRLRSEAEKKRLAEPVTFRVTVPGDGAGHTGQSGFRVDGRLYQNGRSYTLPRAEFESLQSNHYRCWLNEVQFKTLDQHKRGNSATEILAQTMPMFEVRTHA